MKNYADRGGCYPPKRITPSEICGIILHIIQKPNSIIVLLLIQNISRALKIARYLKTMNKKQEKMTNKYLETKTLFKEVTNLPLEACTEPTQYNLASFQFPPRTENCTALRLKFQEFFKLT